jgi:hypothetical protein
MNAIWASLGVTKAVVEVSMNAFFDKIYFLQMKHAQFLMVPDYTLMTYYKEEFFQPGHVCISKSCQSISINHCQLLRPKK